MRQTRAEKLEALGFKVSQDQTQPNTVALSAVAFWRPSSPFFTYRAIPQEIYRLD
jgi:hypothetical protein